MSITKRDWTIDFLKGIAIIMVFMVHSMQPIRGMNYIIGTASHLGQLGCQLFFMLSGYLAVTSYRKIGNGIHFLKKKGSNLLPAWRIMMVVYLIYTLIGVSLFGENCYRPIVTEPLGFVAGWFGMHGIFPAYCNRIIPGGWYVGTLILLYVLTPLFIKLVTKYTKRSLYVYVIACMVVASLIGAVSGRTELFDNNTYGYYSVLVQSGSYLLGMYVAEKKLVGGTPLQLLVWSGITVVLYFSHIPLSFVVVPFTATMAFYHLWQLIKLNGKQLERLRIINLIGELGSRSYYIYFTHIVVVWYMAELIQTILRNLEVTINGTILYVILLLPEIVLTALLSRVLEKSEAMYQRIWGKLIRR